MSSAEAVGRLRRVLAGWTGLDCGRGGRDGELERLLQTRAAEMGMSSAEEYVERLARAEPGRAEVQRLVNAITVGYTWFFRDLELLQLATAYVGDRPAPSLWPSVWVAGCASGDEAYSLAMLAAGAGRRIEITASDINTHTLEVARAAEYGDWSLRLVPRELERFLEPARPGHRRVAAAVRDSVRFKHHNLVDPPLAPSHGGGWDLILCRNVLVYFAPGAAYAVVRGFLDSLSDGGVLVLGSGEVTAAVAELAETVPFGTRTAYRRRSEGPRPPRVRRTLPGVPVPPPRRAPVAAEPPPRRPRLDEMIEQGARLLDGGDVEGALARFVGAVEIDPLCAEARLLIGMAHSLAGDPEAAHAPLRVALFLAPDLWLASFYLARAHEDLGRIREARREYARVLEGAGRPALGRGGGGAIEALLRGWADAAQAHARLALSRLPTPSPP